MSQAVTTSTTFAFATLETPKNIYEEWIAQAYRAHKTCMEKFVNVPVNLEKALEEPLKANITKAIEQAEKDLEEVKQTETLLLKTIERYKPKLDPYTIVHLKNLGILKTEEEIDNRLNSLSMHEPALKKQLKEVVELKEKIFAKLNALSKIHSPSLKARIKELSNGLGEQATALVSTACQYIHQTTSSSENGTEEGKK